MTSIQECSDTDTKSASPIARKPLAWYERLVLWLFSLGAVPRSIGIIPDGNRRYARKIGTSVDEGHMAGAHTLDQIGRWAKHLGIKEETIYVFSTHNFNRPKDEIDGIFKEIEKHANHILDDPYVFLRKGERTICAGDLEMLPRRLQRCLAKLELITSSNSGQKSNLCVAYSARHQLTRMTKKMAMAVKRGTLKPEDITASFIEEYLALEEAPEIEVLLRTSGETRLSDYLLWQSSYAMLYFERKMLPEVTFWDFLKGILYYQVRCQALQRIRAQHRDELAQLEERNPRQFLRQRVFLKEIEAERISYLQKLASDDD